MAVFPQFIRSRRNAIAASSQSAGVEGWLFDGADGSQVAFWQCTRRVDSEEHVHDFDEYVVVVQGEYTVVIDGTVTVIGAGEEFLIHRGVPHSGSFIAGTRTIHAFGGRRANRQINEDKEG